MVWQVRHAWFRFGPPLSGLAGLLWPGVSKCGEIWQGSFGTVGTGEVWSARARFGLAGMEWLASVGCGEVGTGTVRHGR